jgi:Flp pilus assembly pilin Flp
MLKLCARALNWLNGEEGQDLAEYALLVGFIAVVVLAAVIGLAYGLTDFFREAATLIGAMLGTSG